MVVFDVNYDVHTLPVNCTSRCRAAACIHATRIESKALKWLLWTPCTSLPCEGLLFPPCAAYTPPATHKHSQLAMWRQSTTLKYWDIESSCDAVVVVAVFSFFSILGAIIGAAWKETVFVTWVWQPFFFLFFFKHNHSCFAFGQDVSLVLWRFHASTIQSLWIMRQACSSYNTAHACSHSRRVGDVHCRIKLSNVSFLICDF